MSAALARATLEGRDRMRQRLDSVVHQMPLKWRLIVQHMGKTPVSLDRVNRCSKLDTAIGMDLGDKVRFQGSLRQIIGPKKEFGENGAEGNVAP